MPTPLDYSLQLSCHHFLPFVHLPSAMETFKVGFALMACCVLISVQTVYAGTVPPGGNCSVSNNRLDAATHKLLTDCDDKTFCTLQNTCEPKQCRKDEYPFGYEVNEPLPPMCPHGQYCPDEGDACKPWLYVGQTCQLNRDGGSSSCNSRYICSRQQLETNVRLPWTIRMASRAPWRPTGRFQ